MVGGHLFLLGAGEHARVVAETAEAAGWTVAGAFDLHQPPPAWRWPYLGTEDTLPAWRHRQPQARFHLAIGNRAPRTALAARLGNLPWATVVHPAAVVSPSAVLSEGVLVGPLALVHTGACVGRHAIINSGALVEHDVQVGDFAHLAPGATVGGGAILGAGCHIGLGASVRDHVTVGERATVGMGAVVVGAVQPEAIVVGCPARERRCT